MASTPGTGAREAGRAGMGSWMDPEEGGFLPPKDRPGPQGPPPTHGGTLRLPELGQNHLAHLGRIEGAPVP